MSMDHSALYFLFLVSGTDPASTVIGVAGRMTLHRCEERGREEVAKLVKNGSEVTWRVNCTPLGNIRSGIR